ncbi:hypothetical protein ACM9HD_32990, partial [Streptomyces sp. JAC25]|uniref:hypothetical protein n=1 Tax=Streptomyces sp. JAC25 TaxID=3418413 RepID=UPI003D816CC2
MRVQVRAGFVRQARQRSCATGSCPPGRKPSARSWRRVASPSGEACQSNVSMIADGPVAYGSTSTTGVSRRLVTLMTRPACQGGGGGAG